VELGTEIDWHKIQDKSFLADALAAVTLIYAIPERAAM